MLKSLLKKISELMFILITLVLFNGVVAAEGIDIKSVELQEKSANTIITNEPAVNGLNIDFNLQFTNVNDYVIYKVTIVNSYNEPVYIKNNGTTSDSKYDYFTYEYIWENNTSLIPANSSANLTIKIAFTKDIDASDVNADGFFDTSRIIVINFDKNEQVPSTPIENPNTKDTIIGYLLILFILIIIIANFIYIFYTKAKHKELNIYILIISGILVIATLIYKITYAYQVMELTIKSSIKVDTELPDATDGKCFDFEAIDDNTAKIINYKCGGSLGTELNPVIPKYGVAGTVSYTINEETCANSELSYECNNARAGLTMGALNQKLKNYYLGMGVLNIEVTDAKKRKIVAIGDYAFNGGNDKTNDISYITKSPRSIDSIKFTNQITSIGKNAFEINNLTSVEIPDSVTTIGDEAFAYNKLNYVILGEKTITIGNNAFFVGFSYCPSMIPSNEFLSYFYNRSKATYNWCNIISINDDNCEFASGNLTSGTFNLAVYTSMLKVNTDSSLNKLNIKKYYLPNTPIYFYENNLTNKVDSVTINNSKVDGNLYTIKDQDITINSYTTSQQDNFVIDTSKINMTKDNIYVYNSKAISYEINVLNSDCNFIDIVNNQGLVIATLSSTIKTATIPTNEFYIRSNNTQYDYYHSCSSKYYVLSVKTNY